jgi:hypothetical protein
MKTLQLSFAWVLFAIAPPPITAAAVEWDVSLSSKVFPHNGVPAFQSAVETKATGQGRPSPIQARTLGNPCVTTGFAPAPGALISVEVSFRGRPRRNP